MIHRNFVSKLILTTMAVRILLMEDFLKSGNIEWCEKYYELNPTTDLSSFSDTVSDLPKVSRDWLFEKQFVVVESTPESVMTVNSNGDKKWKNSDGELHRTDGPAIEWVDGDKQWYKDGKLHRDNDLPAVECLNESKRWYKDGELHRENDLPTIERANGGKEWHKNGVLQASLTVDSDGDQKWKNSDGKLHRLDGPAVECVNGTKMWYKDGKLSRDNGPAVEYPSGTSWYKDGVLQASLTVGDDGAKRWENADGKLHREDGPAIEYTDGGKRWYKDGELHRDSGPAQECADGTKIWCKEGKRHRVGGPAAEWADGDKWWYKNGELHRDSGPAIERTDGTREFWKNGVRVNQLQEIQNLVYTFMTEYQTMIAKYT